MIVLRVIWIPRAALSLCHCITLMVFFLAAGLIFLALQPGHLCRHGRSMAAHAASPFAHLVLAPARPNCKGLALKFLPCPSTMANMLLCSFHFHVSVPGLELLLYYMKFLKFSLSQQCLEDACKDQEEFALHRQNPTLLVIKFFCSNLHMGQQRDEDRKIGSSGNDNAVLPIMIDACAWHQSFSDLCQQLCKGFQRNLEGCLGTFECSHSGSFLDAHLHNRMC